MKKEVVTHSLGYKLRPPCVCVVVVVSVHFVSTEWFLRAPS